MGKMRHRMGLLGMFYFSAVTKMMPVLHSENMRFQSMWFHICPGKLVSQFVLIQWDKKKGACFTLCTFSLLDAPFRFLMLLICLASPETSSLATWTGMTTLTASLWGECLAFSLPLFSCHPPLSLPQITCCQLLNQVWTDFAIKGALLWRSQLHRRTVISFFSFQQF